MKSDANFNAWIYGILLNLILAGVLMGQEQAKWVVYDGFEGPGKGKHVVLVSGDEEYRSEEALPMLGKILAAHHGLNARSCSPSIQKPVKLIRKIRPILPAWKC